MRVVVTGASGFLGSAVVAALRDRGHEVVRVSGPHGGAAAPVGAQAGARTGAAFADLALDLAAPGAAARLLAAAPAEAIVNCAALPDIAPCRADPALAEALNASFAGELAGVCGARGLRLVHVSTDQVFDGRRGGWREEDAPAPLHAYGASKLRGEGLVLRRHPGAAVLRPALLTGRAPPGRRSATSTLLEALARGGRPRMFTDERRSPVAAADAARVLAELVERGARGLFHCGGPGALTRHELACREAAAAGFDARAVAAGTREEAGLAAERPADLSLDSGRLVALLGWTPRTLAPEA